MSLPTKTIEGLWTRLIAAYGVRFLDQYEGLPIADVKTDWAARLSVFSERLDAVAWALHNLPVQPVNAIAFAALCRQAPAPIVPALPLPPANPERMRAELAKLQPVLSKPVCGDGRDWARRIVARVQAGERVSLVAQRAAASALAGRAAA